MGFSQMYLSRPLASFVDQGHPPAAGHAMNTAETDDEARRVLALVARTCAGDEAAWQMLWRWLDPCLSALVKRFRLGRISEDEDERRGVVLEIVSRLHEGQFRRLKLFMEGRTLDQDLSLMPWLKVVAKRVAIDYLRAHPNYLPASRRAAAAGIPGEWTDPKSLPPASLLPDVRTPSTRDGTAREMLAHAREVLPEKQYQALALKVQGHSPADIAGALGLSGTAEADRTVRAAVERLRRKFRTTLAGSDR
jgi:DNA-directed RNA polymerase specialized sigma24 family protein